MFFAIFIILVLVVFALHELAHGRAMLKYGIRVPEAGLGIPIKHVPCLRIKISPAFTFCLHPFLLGAYVRPAEGEEEKMEGLPYRAKAHIFGAGIAVNLVFSFLLNIGLLLALLAVNPEGWNLHATVLMAVYLPLTAIFLRFGKFLSSYVFPILGLCLTGFLIWSISTLGMQKSVMGPIGIVQMGLSIDTLGEAVAWGAMISMGLAFINLLPLFPFDGGRIFKALLEEKLNLGQEVGNAISAAGFLLVIVFIAAVFLSDLFRVFS